MAKADSTKLNLFCIIFAVKVIKGLFVPHYLLFNILILNMFFFTPSIEKVDGEGAEYGEQNEI